MRLGLELFSNCQTLGLTGLCLFWFLFPHSAKSVGRNDNWTGFSPSLSLLARGGTGVTHPLARQMPEWAKGNVFDSDLFTANPALMSLLGTDVSVSHPIVGRSSVAGGVFSALESSGLPDSSLLDLSDRLALAPGVPQVSKLEVSSRWAFDEAGFAFHFNQSALVESLDSGALEIHRAKDFGAQLGVGGLLFDRSDFGYLQIGTGIKALLRQGNEYLVSNSEVVSGGAIPVQNKIAFAGGLDYGLLYGLPESLLGEWALQLGLGWRDVGSTQFFLGQKTSRNRRFQSFPNNFAIGAGVGLPKFFGGLRNALRLEYLEAQRDRPVSEKFALGWEARFPVLLSLFGGLRGTSPSGGALLRYEGFEVGFASFAERIGEKSTLVRFWNLEVRGVL